MSEILKVSDLRMEYRLKGGSGNWLIAVDGVSFSVEAGQSLAIVGQSGSGKTTCARIVAGLERQTSGTVELCGELVSERPRRRADRKRRATQVQMIFQDPYSSLDPRQHVGAALEEVLAEHGQRDPRARHRNAIELLEKVGLDERIGLAGPSRLSGGQRQRVAIARALAARPEVLILDEAVAALDVSVQAQVIKLLAELRSAEGLTYLFVSHDLGVVRQVSDHCVVMNRGRVVESGTTESVLDFPQHEYTKTLLAAVPRPGWKPERRNTRSSS
jgi:oligopeptide transport system ATP-binding protein